MKNILTITLLLPFYLFSQINDGSVILGVQYGFVQDVNFQDLDVNSYYKLIDYPTDDINTVVEGNNQQHYLDLFFNKGGDDTHLYNFDLNEDSIVFDVGSYKGEYYQIISYFRT